MKRANIRMIKPHPVCRSLSYVLITACILLGFLFSARAFLPTNGAPHFGLFGKSHQKITGEAITELDREFFRMNNLTGTMEKAIDKIAEANAAVDDDQETAAKHFDGESFPEGQARIIALRESVIDALRKNDAEGARRALGSALHTIQDFYSHTNWFELGNRVPHPGLGRPGNDLKRLPATTQTCKGCAKVGSYKGGDACRNCDFNLKTINDRDLITNGLTSGYFGGEKAPFDKKPKGKCSHGSIKDSLSFRGDGINKDTNLCTVFAVIGRVSVSPHYRWHEDAAHLAKEATKQFIDDIKAEVTLHELKLLLGAGPTVGFAIDTTRGMSAIGTTGGMGDFIDGVRQQVTQIVNARLGTNEEPSEYVLSSFNDSSVGPVTVTTDANAFINALNGLSASGGDDCPELSEAGMLGALDALAEGSDLFMFTDASSKDSALTATVSSLARQKDIRIYPILFGSCSPSIDPSYIREANDSGGQLFFLESSEAGSITELADFIVRSNAVNLLAIDDTFAGTARTYTVPVDSTITRLTFSVSGTTSVAVMRPSGSIVQDSDPGVTVLSLSGGKIYSITTPVIGEWSVSVNGTGEVSLEVSGESSLDLSSFEFVEPFGRSGHQGFFPIDGLPLAGQEGTVDAVMSGDFNTAQFSLRSKTGAVLQTFPLSLVPGTTDEFSGQITPSTSSFRVYVTGQDITGANYQRLLSASIRPQTVKIDAPMSQDLHPGQSLTYTLPVTNLGAPDTFSFMGSDDRNYLTTISPTVFHLNTNESIDVTVQVQPPLDATPGTSDTLTVNLVSTGATEASNFGVVTSVVIGNQPPDCSLAQPSVTKVSRRDHKLVSVSILGVTDPDGDPVSIRIDQIRQNEPVTGLQDETRPDGTGIGSSTAMIRAESSRPHDRRTYTIDFTASDGKGGTCQGNVKVRVPNDSKGEGEPAFDSTSRGFKSP